MRVWFNEMAGGSGVTGGQGEREDRVTASRH